MATQSHPTLTPHEPDSLFISLLNRLQRLYSRGLTKRLAPYGVQPGYLLPLHFLWQKDGISQKQLTALMGVEQATVSNTLKRMERDGLVKRTPTRKDKRKHTITLTDHGQSIQDAVMAGIDDMRSVANKGLTVNDRRYLKRIMTQMTEHLEEDQDESFLLLLDEIADVDE